MPCHVNPYNIYSNKIVYFPQMKTSILDGTSIDLKRASLTQKSYLLYDFIMYDLVYRLLCRCTNHATRLHLNKIMD